MCKNGKLNSGEKKTLVFPHLLFCGKMVEKYKFSHLRLLYKNRGWEKLVFNVKLKVIINLLWNNSQIKKTAIEDVLMKDLFWNIMSTYLKTSTMENNFYKMVEIKVRYCKKNHHRRCFCNNLISNFRTPFLWEHLVSASVKRKLDLIWKKFKLK